MADRRWKAQERRIAGYFKTERTSLSGSGSKQTSSDTLHPKLYIETKDRKRHTLWTLFDDTKKKAKVEGKLPVICLTEPNRRGFLVVLCSDDYAYDEYNALVYAQDEKGEFTKIVQDGLTFEFKKEE